MSFFYLNPVKGDLPAHLLEVILFSRLGHLNTVFSSEPPVYNEFVVEGSIYDNVGHFILCIISILSENREFSEYILRTELELFKQRLTSLTAYEMRSFSKKLLRSIKKHDSVPEFIEALQVLCQHLMLKEVAQHMCAAHRYDCAKHNIRIHFKQCLHLVAKRQVEITNGVAVIPCGKWYQYLMSLFRQNLVNRIKKTDLAPLKSDSRIMELLYKIKKQYTFSKQMSNKLLSKDVDSASTYFPPCMLNLHQNLRKRHRLSHTQRFHYSLFLKDIGMPIEESIDFWRSEYRLHPNGHHSCCHNWEKDEKKYIYGIRHMYGLEGCKRNYPSVNCQVIQSIDNSNSEGGCPFKSFDYDKMVPLLKNCSQPVLSQINELKSKGLYTNACMLFMQNGFTKENCDNSSFNFTPVKFYNMSILESKDAKL
ncbi:DNA primase large subunit-like [Helicoverpa armigera]|uniref:DNA primase large subunit-like n=1 Tax=Helicoverpa armigera TaxID=29058 RepID=UPI00308278C3